VETTEPKRCLTCGYILEHLPESRCPECGRGFDPEDSTTWCAQPKSGQAHLIGALTGAVITIIWLVLTLPAFVRLPSNDPVTPAQLVAPGLIAFGIEVVVVITAARALRQPSPVITRRPRLRAAVVIGLLIIGVFGVYAFRACVLLAPRYIPLT
jgi:hypothetical protein